MAIKNTKGFTIFIAVLVGGLALAVGAAIYDLTVRELDLSGTATQSQYAIYAADTGAECALYWDIKCPAGVCPTVDINSAFATSSNFIPPTPPITCGTNADTSAQNIAVQGPPTTDLARFSGCSANNPWCVVSTPTAATTTFSIYFFNTAGAQTYCATVEVAKSGTPTKTTIVSHGYNTCAANGVTRLERVLQVSY